MVMATRQHNLAELPDPVEQDDTPVRGYALGTGFERLKQAAIMMVDDEPLTMGVVQALLEEAGYREFILEDDSTQAVRQIREHNPDVLLLDIMMPEVDGFQILSELRRMAEFQHLPVIILTSSSDAETKLKALDLGATDFLSKPVDPSELALRVRNTLAAKAYQDQLNYYDELTGLPNRKLFIDQGDWAIERASREGATVAMLHITFDEYHRIRETLGPQAVDEVVRQLAGRLEGSLRASDLVGHAAHESRGIANLYCLGGPDFSVLLPSADKVTGASVVAQRILELTSEPFRVEGTEVLLRPSIGISSYPHDADNAQALARLAVSASGQAQAGGGGRIRYFSSDMNEASRARLRLESELRRAIDANEFRMMYQPKIELRGERIVGAEALIRWQSADGEMISPADFIPVAEETGLIVPIGNWVVAEVCRQLACWNGEGRQVKVAVNISARQFFESDLVRIVTEEVERHAIDPAQLVLEVTESLMMEDPERVIDTLHRLRLRGFEISIDDFGTGYSSLSYLKHLPANELKVDRAFVMDIEHSHEDRAMVNAMVFMAHELGLRVCAEGIEDAAQLRYLKEIHCDVCQGFYFSRPLTPEAFVRKLGD